MKNIRVIQFGSGRDSSFLVVDNKDNPIIEIIPFAASEKVPLSELSQICAAVVLRCKEEVSRNNDAS